MTTAIYESDLNFTDCYNRKIYINRVRFYLTYGNALDGSMESITRIIRRDMPNGVSAGDKTFIFDDLTEQYLPKYTVETTLNSSQLINGNSDDGFSEVDLLYYCDDIRKPFEIVIKNLFTRHLKWSDIAQDYLYDEF